MTPGRTPALTLATTSLGFVVVQLDVTIVNVALARIAAGLGASVAGLQWVVDAYTLAFASLLLTAGALGDRLGARRVFASGFTVFTVASAACGAAPSLAALVAARAVQGLGAALLLPCSLALLTHAYLEPAARAKAVGLWAGAAGVALAAGPVMGGVLVDAIGWRGIFLANLPIGLLGLGLTACGVAETERRSGRGLDWAGQITGAVALAALTAALIEGPAAGWRSGAIIALLAAFVVATGLFLLIETRGSSPMLPLSCFRVPPFSGAIALGLLVSFVFYGLLFVLSLYFQRVRGYTPLATGLAFVPLMASVAPGNVLSGRMAARWGVRQPIAVGLALFLAGVASLFLTDATTPYAALTAPLFAVGAGISFVVPPLTAALLASAGAAQFGTAAGTLTASRQVGAAAGVAVFGSFVADPGTFLSGLRAVSAISAGLLLFGGVVTLRLMAVADERACRREVARWRSPL